jgi:pyrophosphatase PpaX
MRELRNPRRAILFDLDGTLIDTTNLILRCFEHSWQNVCGLEHPREALIGTFGIPLRDAMRRLMIETGDVKAAPETKADVDLIERLLDEYRLFNFANHDAMACPFEGVEQVITELRARGYFIGVVTSKGRELAMRGLSLCSSDMIVGGLIDAAIFLEDTSKHKPLPGCAAYVGDSSHDMIAGRQAGVGTVAALWGPFPRHELERERPDHLAESIFELLEIFR